MSLTRYEAQAVSILQQIRLTLTQRGLKPAISFAALTERDGLVVLAVFLDVAKLDGRLEAYCSNDTLHHISTAIKGKRVYLSNSTGLRYVVVFSQTRTLPQEVIYPDHVERGVFPLGEGYHGAITTRNIRNVLVAGEPGGGKSNFLLSLAHTAHKSSWQLYLADPDGHTFSPDVWNGIAAQPVAESATDLLALLEKIEAEIARRKVLFRAVTDNGLPPADVDAYNRLTAQPLPKIMLLADEANSYFDHKSIVERLEDLSRRGRKWGLSIVLAAHNWRSSDVSRGLSAMFATRVCFRVADDTSGVVALNSRVWGKRAQKLNQPGRAIIRLDGGYQVIQTYRLTSEQERQSLAIPVDLSPLNAVERSLVGYALEHLDGRFTINKLAAAFTGQGVSHHQIKTLAQEWERRGWLTTPQHATDARCITDELRTLVGENRTGAQAAQGRTGAHDLAQAVSPEFSGVSTQATISNTGVSDD
jgi:DNA segregation ATPase FtsK/SpoIIIE-like protein